MMKTRREVDARSTIITVNVVAGRIIAVVVKREFVVVPL